jgi:hypothetical protein
MTLGSGVWLIFRQIALDRYRDGSMAQTPSLDILDGGEPNRSGVLLVDSAIFVRPACYPVSIAQ